MHVLTAQKGMASRRGNKLTITERTSGVRSSSMLGNGFPNDDDDLPLRGDLLLESRESQKKSSWLVIRSPEATRNMLGI
jgi:hypothetical protein